MECLWRVSECLLLLMFIFSFKVSAQTLVQEDFTPLVTATCKAGHMTIKVNTNSSFYGAIHARNYRSPACMAYGNGTKLTTLDINLIASQGSPEYCGVIVNNKTEERLVPIAVRIHRTLELADDKFYVITCGKAGFKNARNETSLVSLKVLDKGKRVHEVIYDHPYTLRADISRPDGTYGIRVRSCFAFSKNNSNVPLIDDKGCPVNRHDGRRLISPFKYDETQGAADATIYSMFTLPDTREVHLQCDVAICKGLCPEVQCDDSSSGIAQARAQPNNIYSETTDEGVLMASTTVFVLKPGEFPTVQELSDEGSIRPPWLLYLCIAFGLMFLIMLVINIFLCSAMTCSCARTEVIEKEPSIIEDYDPYRSWHGSQYGSRYSLNGKPGYVSGGSTMNSTRSISTNSDHYAIVHSRPGSRYSPGSKPNQRGPGSNLGSHYSGKM